MPDRGPLVLGHHPAQNVGDAVFGERSWQDLCPIGFSLAQQPAERVGHAQFLQGKADLRPAESARIVVQQHGRRRLFVQNIQHGVRLVKHDDLCSRVMHPNRMGKIVRDNLVGFDDVVPVLQ